MRSKHNLINKNHNNESNIITNTYILKTEQLFTIYPPTF